MRFGAARAAVAVARLLAAAGAAPARAEAPWSDPVALAAPAELAGRPWLGEGLDGGLLASWTAATASGARARALWPWIGSASKTRWKKNSTTSDGISPTKP